MDPGPLLKLCTLRVGPWIVMRLEGELDSSTDFTVEEAVENLVTSGVDLLAFDLSQLTFTDSSGLNVFVKSRARLLEKGGRLAMVSPGGLVLRAFQVTGLTSLFEQYETVEALPWPTQPSAEAGILDGPPALWLG